MPNPLTETTIQDAFYSMFTQAIGNMSTHSTMDANQCVEYCCRLAYKGVVRLLDIGVLEGDIGEINYYSE